MRSCNSAYAFRQGGLSIRNNGKHCIQVQVLLLNGIWVEQAKKVFLKRYAQSKHPRSNKTRQDLPPPSPPDSRIWSFGTIVICYDYTRTFTLLVYFKEIRNYYCYGYGYYYYYHYCYYYFYSYHESGFPSHIQIKVSRLFTLVKKFKCKRAMSKQSAITSLESIK